MDPLPLQSIPCGFVDPFQLRVVGDVAMAVEHGQVLLDDCECWGRVVRPVRPAHRDGDAVDVDHGGPRVLVSDLEPEALPGPGTVHVQVRVDGLEVGDESAEVPFLVRSRLPFVEPLVGFSGVAFALGDQVEGVAQYYRPTTRGEDGHM